MKSTAVGHGDYPNNEIVLYEAKAFTVYGWCLSQSNPKPEGPSPTHLMASSDNTTSANIDFQKFN